MSAKLSFFGGMGSWNDLWFENEEKKKNNALSIVVLYGIMMRSIVSSINKDNME
jgi:hypothetical protein